MASGRRRTARFVSEHGWAVHLDELAAVVEEQRRLVSAGRYDEVAVPSARPPQELGPLPPRLVDRASKVLVEWQRLTAAVSQARADVSSELRRLRRPLPGGARSATYVDGYG